MLSIRKLLSYTMFGLCLCLFWEPMDCIKIGISHDYNTSTSTSTSTSTTTTSTTTITTELPTTTMNLELNTSTTSSSWPETSSTPSQTFPPRITQKPNTTAAPAGSNTTPTAAATTESPLINTTDAPATAMFFQDYRSYYCDCDFYADLCEINCCCDRDCPSEKLQVFNCLHLTTSPELQTRLEDFQYTHGLPACQLHDGWLCVFRSNTKPEKPQPVNTNFEAEDFNKWPELLGAYETQLLPGSYAAHYKYGQPLQLWQPESKELSNFELPMSYESASCQLTQTLRHLEPMQSSCLMNDVAQMQSNLWTLLNLTSNQLLLHKPHDLEDQDVQGVNVQICQKLLLQPKFQCAEQGNDTQLDILVDSIQLELQHNYTHILAAKLLLMEASVQDENEPLWLNYEVVYKSKNKNAPAKPSSGPLGYQQGAPVLLAMLQPKNNSEKEEHQLSYYQNQGPHYQHWLMLCGSNVEERQAVGFGVDLARQCQLRRVDPLLPTQDNKTDFCQKLQVEIWRQLLPYNCTQLPDLGQVFASQLGRPQPDKWLPLQLTYAEGQPYPPIQSIYNEQQQSLSCRNMVLSVGYEFHVAELTLLEGRVPHQSILQHARLVLGQRRDLEFDAGEQQVELPLAVSVMFYKPHNRQRNGANIPIIGHNGVIIIALLISTKSSQLF